MHFSDDGSYDLSIERKNSKDFSEESSSSSIASFKMFEPNASTQKQSKFTIESDVLARYAKTIVEYESVRTFFVSLILIIFNTLNFKNIQILSLII